VRCLTCTGSLRERAAGTPAPETGRKKETPLEPNAIRIHPGDNVAVALREIEAGQGLAGAGAGGVTAREAIPKNHKVALRDIPEGGPVVKYGERIGSASRPIRCGQWVHTHNMRPEEEL